MSKPLKDHDYWMRKALELAEKAQRQDEVPVGALIVQNGKWISSGYNRKEQIHSPLGHAELIAIQKASQKLGAWRLLDCTLYVTLEPCPMCAGALVQARVGTIVYGTHDSKGGGLLSNFQIGLNGKLNHTFEVISGIREEECSHILKAFFKKRRDEKKSTSLF